MTVKNAPPAGKTGKPGILSLFAICLSVAFFLPLIMKSYWPITNGLDPAKLAPGRDFINVWLGAKLAFNGQVSTLFDYPAYAKAAKALYGRPIPMWWTYPPTALILYYPFKMFSYLGALFVWSLTGATAFLLAARAYMSRQSPWFYAVLCLSPAFIVNLINGQTGFFTTSLFVGGFLLLRRHPVLAGILFGLLTFKPQIGIVIPVALVALRAWRTIAVAGIVTSALAGAATALFGWRTWVQLYTVTFPRELIAFSQYKGLVMFMVSPESMLYEYGMSLSPAMVYQAACSIIILIAVYFVLRKNPERWAAIFMLTASMPLISPYLLNYDLTSLSIPLTALLLQPGARPSWQTFVYFAAWLVPSTIMIFGNMGQPAIPVLCLAGAFGLSVFEAGRSVSESNETGRAMQPVA